MKLLILPALALLLATNAYAADKFCTINDMNGNWRSYQGAVLVNPHTGVCDFKVANGLAQGTCDFSNGFQGPFKVKSLSIKTAQLISIWILPQFLLFPSSKSSCTKIKNPLSGAGLTTLVLWV